MALVARSVYIKPQLETLNNAQRALCGGDVDFTYTTTMSGAVHWSEAATIPTPKDSMQWTRSGPAEWRRMTGTQKVVETVLLHNHSDATCLVELCAKPDPSEVRTVPICCGAKSGHAPSVSAGVMSVMGQQKLSVTENAALVNPSCVEMAGRDYSTDALLAQAVSKSPISSMSCSAQCEPTEICTTEPSYFGLTGFSLWTITPATARPR